MDRDREYLIDLDKAAHLIVQFTSGITKESFLANDMKQSAVLYQIMVVGEVVKRLSKEFRLAHPHTPWSEIAGMRDRLIHGYHEVDMVRVWNAATINVPELIAAIQPLLPERDD